VARAEAADPADPDPADPDPDTADPADPDPASPDPASADPASADPENPGAGPAAAIAALSPHAPTATAISLGTRIDGSFHQPRRP
jgi:hypothetical protein